MTREELEKDLENVNAQMQQMAGIRSYLLQKIAALEEREAATNSKPGSKKERQEA